MARNNKEIIGENREIGLGTQGNKGQRTVNNDGSANIIRVGVSQALITNTFHSLISMTWKNFLLMVVSGYLIVNLFFATLYVFAGIENLGIVPSGNVFRDFAEAFFFSTQSFTTVGYGRVNPQGIFTNVLASLESLCGLLAFALATGLLYGRFSKPGYNFIYSPNILIAPYKPEMHGLMYRFANTRTNQLLDCEVQVIMSFDAEDDKGNVIRRFRNLELEVSKISIFTLSWTVVHPLNEKSPLFEMTNQDFEEIGLEFLIIFKALDESTSQLIHTRHSYMHHEIVLGGKFISAVDRAKDGRMRINYKMIGDYDKVELPELVRVSEIS